MATLYTYDSLFAFANNIFIKLGFNSSDASSATNSLLAADIRGVDSHGIARLIGYVRLIDAGRINPKAVMQIVHETPSTATVDGDKGLGLVVAPFAMQIAIEKARQVGTGWVAVKNSSHFGIAGKHAMMALEHDMIGICMTNASALVAPTFSIEKLLGTNPIAVAIPAGDEPPFVADFATTTASNGKLEILQRKQAQAPVGWLQDQEGNTSINASELSLGGALLPLGSDREHSSHKGYALGAIVDIFSGVLGGANYGPWVPPFPAYIPMPSETKGDGIGHFFGAMRVDAFRPAADFKANMDTWIQRFHGAKTVSGQSKVYVPGDIERDIEATRAQEGIPLVDAVIKDLKELSSRFNETFL